MPLDDLEKAQILSRIDRLQRLLVDLDRVVGTRADRARSRERMTAELEAAKELLRTFATHDPA
jgi:tRNA C32,U32 (ribose-2'-O)-methylase TrmJ